MSTEIQPYQLAIEDSAERFKAIAGQMIDFEKESIFAMQAICKNDYSYKIANSAPNSVLMAMFNVASTGLTLNPANGYAYLVPRDGQIMLDISYKGLIKIATDAGGIAWARSDCVYAGDNFTYRGPAMMPEIVANPFADRGAIIGAYCIAKTVGGDILTEVMDLDALHQVRSASTAFTKGAAGRKGPWDDYFAEMCRKAVTKRASKTWPYTDRDGRLAVAVDIANSGEGGYSFDHGDTGAEQLGRDNDDDMLRRRKAHHDEALGRNSESVAFIKQRLEEAAADDATASEVATAMLAVATEWRAMPQDDQRALWLATTKGGCFTTAQRSSMRTLPAVVTPEAPSC